MLFWNHLSTKMHKIRVLPVGDRAVLLDLADLDAALAIYQLLNSQVLPGVIAIVPAAKTILISFDRKKLRASQVRHWVDSAVGKIQSGTTTADDKQLTADSPLVEIPVKYDGQDLGQVAEYLGISTAELIKRHTGTEFIGAFAGFAPGFVYLANGDPCFTNIPRLPTPRTRVPASSIAVAGDFSAIYPKVSPGGWQLLGTTPERMWDLDRSNPALIKPGYRVRFYDLANSGRTYSLPAEPKKPHTNKTLSNYLEMVSPGVQTLVQDFGRPGLTSLGVSNSGALDRRAMSAANALVGNPLDYPVLENAMGGLHIKFHADVRIAITGAQTNVILSTESGVRIPAASNTPIRAAAGNILKLGPARAGMRFYIAVQGGFDMPSVLGSYATDILAGIGPEPLKRGDKLAVYHFDDQAESVAQKNDDQSALISSVITRKLPKPHQLINLDIIAGPRNDWFAESALRDLTEQQWQVSAQSNRVGLRLQSDRPLQRIKNSELPSEGTIAGAIQVPASGQPVLFLADHPLTGGYPVIAVLASKYLDLAGQIPINALLKFNLVEAD